MNETINTLLTRRSIRKFKKEDIKQEELDLILKAGTYAPNGRGLQAPLFVVIKDKELMNKLSKLNNMAKPNNPDMDAFYGCNVLVIVFADSSVSTYLEDGSLALGNMMNAAAALGIGSCWIHRAKQTFEFEEGIELKKEWNIPENFVGIGNLILGYPDETPTAKPRKDNYIIYK